MHRESLVPAGSLENGIETVDSADFSHRNSFAWPQVCTPPEPGRRIIFSGSPIAYTARL